jgi:hypothetical protein
MQMDLSGKRIFLLRDINPLMPKLKLRATLPADIFTGDFNI